MLSSRTSGLNSHFLLCGGSFRISTVKSHQVLRDSVIVCCRASPSSSHQGSCFGTAFRQASPPFLPERRAVVAWVESPVLYTRSSRASGFPGGRNPRVRLLPPEVNPWDASLYRFATSVLLLPNTSPEACLSRVSLWSLMADLVPRHRSQFRVRVRHCPFTLRPPRHPPGTS